MNRGRGSGTGGRGTGTGGQGSGTGGRGSGDRGQVTREQGIREQGQGIRGQLLELLLMKAAIRWGTSATGDLNRRLKVRIFGC